LSVLQREIPALHVIPTQEESHGMKVMQYVGHFLRQCDNASILHVIPTQEESHGMKVMQYVGHFLRQCDNGSDTTGHFSSLWSTNTKNKITQKQLVACVVQKLSMAHIAIISASVRKGRVSHRVALYFKKYLEANELATAEILDLNEYNFPLFDERLMHQENPAPHVLDFSRRISDADGVLIVTPEYNGGYPASLKNVVDLLYKEWKRKPVGISMVSNGIFGGTQVITSLLFSLWKIGAFLPTSMFPCPSAQEHFDEAGNSNDPGIDKRAALFLKELFWCIEAKKRMEGWNG
jgi:NAD(P)H-dependent FMN reductase